MLQKSKQELKPGIQEGTFLRSMELKTGEREGKAWEAVSLGFKKGDAWVNGMIFNPKKANFDSKEKYEKARLRTVTLLENIASVYLSSEEMLDLLHRATSFSGYFMDLKEFMEPKEYWTIPVDIKVLPGRRGPETAVFPPFIRKAGDTTVPLRFSEHELKLFNH